MRDEKAKIKRLQQRIKILERMLLEEVLKNDLLCQKSNALTSSLIVLYGKNKNC